MGMIVVVDGTAPERFQEVRHRIVGTLERGDPRAVLVVSNKQDLPASTSSSRIRDSLALDDHDVIRGRKFEVMSVSCVTGEGLYECLDWLADALAEPRS